MRRLALPLLVALAACAPRPEPWPELKRDLRVRFPDVAWISVDELAAQLAGPGEPPLLVDARSDAEFAVSHLAGALHAETRAEALAPLADVPRDREIVLYCAVGYRSAKLARALQRDGFTDLRNLEGSIFEWANTGHPVVDAEGPAAHVHPWNEEWGALLDRDLWP